MFDFYFTWPLWVRLFIQGLAVIAVMFPIAAACSMAERKVAAWVQGRPGPNRTIMPFMAYVPFLGKFLQGLGIFQLAADGMKFMFKEDPIPGHVNKFYFLLAPLVALVPAFTTVCVVPLGAWWDGASGVMHPLILANVDVGLLAIFAISSLGVYALILAGWASNSKYSFLGSVRASAQLVSYELAMTLSVVPLFLWINAPGGEGTLSLFNAVQAQSSAGFHWHSVWFVFYFPVSAFIFLVALFAETNRQPFDMPESESDLVGGFHTEYGAFKWALFFVAEYANMLVGSAVFVLLFLGGWNILPGLPLHSFAQWLHFDHLPLVYGIVSIAVFVGKVLALIFFFMLVRWTLPRFRYDQVMNIGWRKLLPLAIANLIVYALIIAFLDTRG